MDKITVEGKRFIDAYGRHRIFNGINVCDKTSGREYIYGEATAKLNGIPYREVEIKKFEQWGFNIVRLGITWGAIEPKPREYDEVYIDRIVDYLDICEKHGIYVFLDMHQDLFGGEQKFTDGAPEWACLKKGKKVKGGKKVWAEPYFWNSAVHNCFDSFWNNDEYNGVGLQTYFCDMWVHLVERIKDHPALFGFDLFNEPHNGSDGGKTFKKLLFGAIKTGLTDKRINKLWSIKQILTGNAEKVLEPFEDPDLYRKAIKSANELLKRFDEEKYSPLLNKLTKAIRSVTNNGIIMYETGYFANLGAPFCIPAVSVDGIREKNQCFTPHGYDIFADIPGKGVSNSRVCEIFEQKKRDSERLNVPVVVGEWGGFGVGLGKNLLEHLDFLLSKFDENKWSQTYAMYEDFFIHTKNTFPVLNSLVRPVPIAVCGEIDFYRHDKESSSFTLEFTQNREFDVPTIIYAHREIEYIETDGEYKIIPIENSVGSYIEITTDVGKHKVLINFE